MKKSESCPKLKSIAQVPPHLAFNKYVLYGYRVNYNLSECLKSLFFLHNESVNVYTHAIMLIVAMSAIPKTLPIQAMKDLQPLLMAFHIIACIFPFIASIGYHLFMCHYKGPSIYQTLLNIDIVGVWITNTLGFVIPIWAITHCHYTVGCCILSFYLAISCYVLLCILSAKKMADRTRPLLLFVVGRISIIAFRFFAAHNFGDRDALYYYLFADLLGAMGALINICRLPERFLPGSFDFFLNSHQLMHLSVMCAIWFLHKAALKDLHWMIGHPNC